MIERQSPTAQTSVNPVLSTAKMVAPVREWASRSLDDAVRLLYVNPQDGMLVDELLTCLKQ